MHQSKDEQGNKVEGTENFITEDYSYAFPTTWIFTFIPRWIKFFNSFEAPELPKIKKNKFVFHNEAYLHKLKYWQYYKVDQFKDLYKKIKKRQKDRKLSFVYDLEEKQTWLNQAATVNRKMKLIELAKLTLERFDDVRQVESIDSSANRREVQHTGAFSGVKVALNSVDDECKKDKIENAVTERQSARDCQDEPGR